MIKALCLAFKLQFRNVKITIMTIRLDSCWTSASPNVLWPMNKQVPWLSFSGLCRNLELAIVVQLEALQHPVERLITDSEFKRFRILSVAQCMV